METWLVLLIILLILCAIVAARIVFEVTHPEVSRYAISSAKLPSNERVRIAFLSDLHARKYGKNNLRLIKMVSKTKPDFIVLGGDIMNASSFRSKDNVAIDAISGLSNIAPVFYAPGNHEKKLSENEKQRDRYEDYMFELECMDVTWLQDQKAILTEDIYIYGLDIDSDYYTKFSSGPKMPVEYIENKLGIPDGRKFNIMLAHTPEFFDSYVRSGFDLVLCGHYHGGTINLPWIGPLIAPQFKWRPQHSGGAYKKNGTSVIVTRGIGSHFVNIRLFNRPEVVVIDIRHPESAGRKKEV